MKSPVKTGTLLLVAAITLCSSFSVQAGCSAVHLRPGLIDTPECTISPEDLKRALKVYEMRRSGLKAVEWEPPKSEPLPDLEVTRLRVDQLSNEISLRATAVNLGASDAG